MDLYLLMASSTAINHQKGQPRSLCKVVVCSNLDPLHPILGKISFNGDWGIVDSGASMGLSLRMTRSRVWPGLNHHPMPSTLLFWGTRGEGPWMEVPGDPSILPLCRTTEAKSPLLSVKILVIENYTKWKFRDKVMYKRIKTPSYNLVIFPSKKTNEGIGEFHRSVMFSVQHKIKWNWRYRRM